MANSYLQFSEVLPQLTDAEITWLREQLQQIYVFDGKEYTEEQLPAQFDPERARWSGCRAFLDMPDYDAEFNEGAGFEYQFILEPDEQWGRRLWLYAKESGYASRVAHLVQKFLRVFRPQDCWSLTYSLTSSEPRVGEFGGGAVFVTASEIKWDGTDDFVERERNLFVMKTSSTALQSAGSENPDDVWTLNKYLLYDFSQDRLANSSLFVSYDEAAKAAHGQSDVIILPIAIRGAASNLEQSVCSQTG